METSDQTGQTSQGSDEVVSAAEQTAERIAERLGASVRAAKVFGDPIERGGVTVVPVARARWGFGGGGGRGGTDQPGGAGGGGGATMSPIGYIEIRDDGTTRFNRTVSAREVAAMAGIGLLAAVLAAGMARAR